VFERFTERARESVVLAQGAARELRHGYIGTEHLLLGVAGVGDGVGARVLRRVGIGPDEIRDDVVRLVGEGYPGGLGPGDADALRSLGIDLDEIRRRTEEAFGPGALERAVEPRATRWRRRRGCGPMAGVAGHIPFTPRAKKVLELSLREALRLGHGYIGTEHILLGLIREGEGLGAMILVRRGGDLDRVRRMVVDELRGPGDASGPLVPSA
jgi:ATP-dependent Clp protease ATP-binding subunit ClpA